MTERASARPAGRRSADRSRSNRLSTGRHAKSQVGGAGVDGSDDTGRGSTRNHNATVPVRRKGAALTVTALAALSLVVSGCGADDEGDADTQVVRLYGADGNMTSAFGDMFKDMPGLLNGMKGTAPLNPLTDDFKRRLKNIDPQLKDFNYAGEAYDATVVAALAAETARSTDGTQIAKYMGSVTVGKGTNSYVCDSVSPCLDALRAGKDIAYRGVSMRRGGFNDHGDPSTGTYGTLVFSKDNRIDQAKTEYVGAGDDKSEIQDVPAAPTSGSRTTQTPLKIGGLLPRTGDLASLGGPMCAGAQLAIKDINDLGGVLGRPIVWVDGDDGTDAKIAGETADRHIAAGVQVIIGAGASGITKAVLPKITSAGRLLISPSATSDELTTIDDKNLFFRTSPPDQLQSKALVDVLMRYGAERVVVIARDDTYGKGLADKVAGELKATGVKADRIKTVTYQVRDRYSVDLFTDIAEDTKRFQPDAVLVVGFEESSNCIKALSAQGVKFHD